MKIWYTYHIIDPQNNKVFYVGKGFGQRAYIHMTRALKWRETGKIIPGGNKHLYNKLLKIYDKGLQPLYSIVLTSLSEKEVFDREKSDIELFGIDNLCNLTLGGEGETKTQKTLEKMSASMKAFWASDDGYKLRDNFSKERIGEKNPMWGSIEDENHKKERMAPMLSKPRWNKGLRGDPRAKGPPKGEPSHNSIACRLINNDGRIFQGRSISELSKISGVPLISIMRLKNKIHKTNKQGWKLELL